MAALNNVQYSQGEEGGLATYRLLKELDADFRNNIQKENPVGMSCGICVHRYNGQKRTVELLVGELQGKKDQKLNGKYATFSGKPDRDKDFGDGLVPFNVAGRETEEELGLDRKLFLFATNGLYTFVVKNASYGSFLGPILFIKSTSAIEQTVKNFEPKKEIRQVRWIDAASAVSSAKEIQTVYLAARKAYLEKHAPSLLAEWQGEQLTNEQIDARLEKEVRKNPELESLRDGDPRAPDSQTGETIPLAPYTSRTILEAQQVLMEIANLHQAEEQKA